MKRYSISQRYRSRGIATWYGRISDGGIVKYVSLGVTRRADALEWLNARNAEKFLPDALFAERQDRAFTASVRAFLESVEVAHGAGSATIRAYASILSNFSAWAERAGISTLRDITREHAQAYSSALCSSLAPKTARERIRVCRQFTGWCAGIYGIDDWKPFGMVQMPRLEKRRKAFWTMEQVNRILDAAPSPAFRLFWSLMAFAGLRHAEACAFGPESLTGDGRLHVIGKGSKEALEFGKGVAKELQRKLFKEADQFIKKNDSIFPFYYDTSDKMRDYFRAKFIKGCKLPNGDFLSETVTMPFATLETATKKIRHSQESAAISDIINGVSRGKMSLGYGHSNSYWNFNSIGWESFTHFGTLSESDSGLAFLKKYLAEQLDQWKQMIKSGADKAPSLENVIKSR